METKYIRLLLWTIIMGMTFNFLGCSSNDDPVITEEETQKLTLDKDNIRIPVGNTTSFNITGGNGEYNAFSLNEDIVEVEIVDNKIIANAITMGKTAIVISDKSNQYKQVPIISLYENIILEKQDVQAKILLGHSKEEVIEIEKGNGGYEAFSDNPEIATAKIEKETLHINCIKAGEVSILIKDRFGVEASLSVTITSTTTPYSDNDLEAIKNKRTRVYDFNNQAVSYYWYNYFNTIENDMNLYGWQDPYSGEHLKIYFPGNKNPGIKKGAIFSSSIWGEIFKDESIKLEIIKNDGEYIWGVYSFISNEKLMYGYFMLFFYLIYKKQSLLYISKLS